MSNPSEEPYFHQGEIDLNRIVDEMAEIAGREIVGRDHDRDYDAASSYRMSQMLNDYSTTQDVDGLRSDVLSLVRGTMSGKGMKKIFDTAHSIVYTGRIYAMSAVGIVQYGTHYDIQGGHHISMPQVALRMFGTEDAREHNTIQYKPLYQIARRCRILAIEHARSEWSRFGTVAKSAHPFVPTVEIDAHRTMRSTVENIGINQQFNGLARGFRLVGRSQGREPERAAIQFLHENLEDIRGEDNHFLRSVAGTTHSHFRLVASAYTGALERDSYKLLGGACATSAELLDALCDALDESGDSLAVDTFTAPKMTCRMPHKEDDKGGFTLELASNGRTIGLITLAPQDIEDLDPKIRFDRTNLGTGMTTYLAGELWKEALNGKWWNHNARRFMKPA